MFFEKGTNSRDYEKPDIPIKGGIKFTCRVQISFLISRYIVSGPMGNKSKNFYSCKSLSTKP